MWWYSAFAPASMDFPPRSSTSLCSIWCWPRRKVIRMPRNAAWSGIQATAPTCGLESCQSASTCLASVALSSMTAWVAVLLHSSIT